MDEFDVFSEFEETTSCEFVYAKREIQKKKLIEFFEAYIESFDEQRGFEWKSIYIFYKYHKEFLFELTSLQTFCSFVLHLFYEFNCPEIHLIHRILDMYEQTDTMCLRLDACSRCRTLHFFGDVGMDVKHIFLPVLQLTDSEFKFRNRWFYLRVTQAAVRNGHIEILRCLVKYGLCHFFNDDEMFQLKVIFRKFLQTYNDLRCHEGSHEDINSYGISDDNISKFMETENVQSSRRLILLMYNILNTVKHCLGDQHVHYRFKCLHLVHEVFAEPHFTVDEVHRFMKYFFSDFSHDATVEKINQQVFFICKEFLTPVSLQVLCRTKIRESLRRESTLPYAIPQLKLPRTIEKYLLFLRKN